jgi:hypothetical protein
MCCTWIFTVVSAMSSERAISLLPWPCAMPHRISCSRGDKASSFDAGAAGSGTGTDCGAAASR